MVQLSQRGKPEPPGVGRAESERGGRVEEGAKRGTCRPVVYVGAVEPVVHPAGHQPERRRETAGAQPAWVILGSADRKRVAIVWPIGNMLRIGPGQGDRSRRPVAGGYEA
jgi:hypothetical protein